MGDMNHLIRAISTNQGRQQDLTIQENSFPSNSTDGIIVKKIRPFEENTDSVHQFAAH